MKIVVLSDIHSNVFALEAVIEDAKKHGVVQILNLGDIFYGPIAPKATYDLQKAVKQAQKQQRGDWGHFLSTGRGL